MPSKFDGVLHAAPSHYPRRIHTVGNGLLDFASTSLDLRITWMSDKMDGGLPTRQSAPFFVLIEHFRFRFLPFVSVPTRKHQDGIFDASDFLAMFQDEEVQRLMRAYEPDTITMDVHCAAEGPWTMDSLDKHPSTKSIKVPLNEGLSGEFKLE